MQLSENASVNQYPFFLTTLIFFSKVANDIAGAELVWDLNGDECSGTHSWLAQFYDFVRSRAFPSVPMPLHSHTAQPTPTARTDVNSLVRISAAISDASTTPRMHSSTSWCHKRRLRVRESPWGGLDWRALCPPPSKGPLSSRLRRVLECAHALRITFDGSRTSIRPRVPIVPVQP